MRRALLGLVIAALVATGCSKSSSTARSPGSTATSSSTSSPRSARELDQRVCAAYSAFWNTADSGGEPSPAMVARERALIDAAEATSDRALHDAVRAVIDGELGLPKFDLHDTAAYYEQNRNRLPPDARAALAAVQHNDQLVETKCDAMGRPING